MTVGTNIWLGELALPWDHRDPAHRVMVATALGKGVPLMTRDETVRSAGIVATVW